MLLWQENGDANSVDEVGRTPLSYAAEFGLESIASTLLERADVDANSADRVGRTPLSYAAEFGRESIASMLLA